MNNQEELEALTIKYLQLFFFYILIYFNFISLKELWLGL